MKLKILLLFLFFKFFLVWRVFAIPVFQTLSFTADTVGLYEKFEITVSMTANFTNPFDYNQITLKANFIDKDNQWTIVDGFYYQDYTINAQGLLSPNGQPVWKVRFSPPKTGNWKFYLQATDQQGTSYHNVYQFYVKSSGNKGFIKSTHPRYLQYDNGQPFFPVGMNMCWSVWDEYSFTVYQKWLDSLATNGGNNIKIMMVPWGMSLEWNNTPVGNYTNRLDRAYALDWTLEKAKERDISLQLCMVIHGELMNNVSGTWDQNPYNVLKGGPCQNAQDFFANTYAKLYFRQKLRYINARWGYLTNIWSWEVLSEADQINYYGNFSSVIRSWMIEMGNYIQNIDLHHRIVSSGYAVKSKDPAYWQNADVDYTQLHIYDQIADLELSLYNGVTEYLSEYSKPAFVSEYALDHTPATIIEDDPEGISMRNCLWSTAMSGALGTGLHWWWDNYVFPQNLFHVFKPVSRVMSSVDPITDNLISEAPVCSSAINIDMEVVPRIVDAFQRAPENQFLINSSGIVTPSVTKMNKFEYGYLFNSYRNPPTFTVNYSKPGEFRVYTGNTVTFSNIKIWLDGSLKIDQSAFSNNVYTINVPVGQHTIFVENSGNGMMEISRYFFFNYSPVVRTFMLRNSKKAVGWFQNRKYNWQYIQENGTPTQIPNGKINLGHMTPGYYSMEWINGANGLPDSTSNIIINQQTPNVNVPSVVWDGAFKLNYKYAMIPDFGSNVQQGYNPLTVQFFDQTQSAVGETTNWYWSFGDGGWSSQKNPVHTYLQAGLYNVWLIVQSGTFKDSIQKIKYIHVSELLEPAFNAAPTIAQNGDPIQFYDLSVGNVIQWTWQFGDGTTSSLKNPVKSYDNPGIYTVSLTVKAGNITKTITKTGYITIVSRLVTQFSASPSQVLINQPVQFTDLSAGSPTEWLWQFGNGSISSLQNPQFSYSQPGSYSVKLIIKKQNFADSLLKTDVIQVYPPLIAGYYTDKQVAMPGEIIQFVDTTSGDPLIWLWDFGDGFSSGQQFPEHNYMSPGTYNVKLKVIAGFRSDSIVKTNYITILEPLEPDFTAYPTQIITDGYVSFTDVSSGSPTSWFWTFGDNQTSELQNPTHQYHNAGDYSVTLKIGRLNYSDSVTFTSLIQVFDPLIANFTAGTQLAQTGEVIQFTDLSSGDPLNWFWDFGDGTVSDLQNPQHSYLIPGLYSVKLKVSAGFRIDSITLENLITIKAPLVANFSAAPTFLLTGNPVQFNDLSAGQPLFWIWDFGDQINGIGENPVHIYENPGLYAVTLIVINEFSSDTIVKEAFIEVLPPIHADFSANKTIIHQGQSITFTDLSTGSPTSWKWDFGEGRSINQKNPVYTYKNEGIFTVKLLVKNSLNQDLAVKTNYITVLPPLNTQILQIPQGWSGISGFIKPDTSLISHVFSPILNDLVIIKNFSSAFWPEGGLYSLNDWNSQSGYEIKMANQATLTLSGISENNKTVVLNEGWNLLPVISPCNVSAALAFSDLTGLIMVKEVAGNRIYWPAPGIYTLDSLFPGKSYHLLIAGSDELTFSSCSGEDRDYHYKSFSAEVEINPFNVVKSPASHVVAIPYELINEKWQNQYLIAITSTGTIAGWCKLQKNIGDKQNKACCITVFEDDVNTSDVEGFATGELMQFYISDDHRILTEKVDFDFDPDFPYHQYFIPYGYSKVASVTEIQHSESFLEVLIYPNPTAGQLMVSIPQDFLPVNLYLTSISQQKCLIEVENWNEPIYQTDLSAFSRGIYLLKLENESHIDFKKIILN